MQSYVFLLNTKPIGFSLNARFLGINIWHFFLQLDVNT